MTDADFPLDGGFPLDPSPDEEAWSTYVEYAREIIGGNPDNGITNAQLAELEELVGTTLPFELALLLLLGVPDDEKWWQWKDDPSGQLSSWNSRVRDGVLFDVEHNGVWVPAWGKRPEGTDDQLSQVTSWLEAAPQLFPVWSHRCIPLGPAEGANSPDGNPVLSVMQTDIIVYGDDLAAWLHREFAVPLPAWPAPTTERVFPFWSALLGAV